ncbi:MAG: branched-chain amino acid ABC transporter ATP-binding protein/permease [Actinomycetota bacterium]|nr:branched-chain amino acid ABC transporter ATP-binding protein/permease [Actinomycetota bacterium]
MTDVLRSRVPWKSAALLLGLAAFPALPFVPYSLIGSANLAASYALVAISLVLLTGWVGQISLGHAAFVGIGAYATGWASQALNLPFPISLPIAGLAGAAAAVVMGGVALRVRGLYLAVATLIFSWMADSYLFRQPWVTEYASIPGRRIGGERQFPAWDLTSRRAVYYLVWALVVIALLAAANIRDSKTGRAFFAVRGSEVAAASLGIDVTHSKLVAFAVSGFMAAMGGAAGMVDSRVVSADQFTFSASLFFLAVAVVGGIRSLAGAIGSAMLFASLTELFFRVEALSGYLEVVSAGLLAVVLLVQRGGLAAMAANGTARLRGFLAPADGDGGDQEEKGALRPVAAIAPALAKIDNRPREEREPIVRADGLTVRFGGLTAVNGVSLEVRQGEVVGLIGPNGAGKTVTFNSIAGLVVPTEGRIELYGTDVTDLPVHRRARMGVARTFQLIQLFPQLSVFDNLLVATHVHNPIGFVDSLIVTERAVRQEAAVRERATEVVERLGLGAVAGSRVADLPFGVLRMVEVARALVTGFRFVMLDEPASGLDNNETDKLVGVLRGLNADGITLLLIEHDVKMVTSVSDYIYVLDRGTLIAEGVPDVIRSEPAVVQAYLGKSHSAEAVPA